MQQNINSTPLSAATWETRRTLILGWNASPQGFRGLTKRTRQRWDLLKLNDQIDRSIWPRKNLKVFIDTEEMENDTLEEIYGLCRSVYSIDVDTHSLNCFFFRGKLRLHQGPPKVVINSSSEDISLSIADELPSRWKKTMNQPFSSEFRQDDVPQYSSRPSSSLAIQSASPRYHKNDPIKKRKKKEHNLCQLKIKAF